MKEVMYFNTVQEMIHFMNAKPVEPKRFEEEAEKVEDKKEKPKKKKGKKDEVLQAD